MSALGLFGLHVVFGSRWAEPTADFTCWCGFASAAAGAGPVSVFVEREPGRHRAECRLKDVSVRPSGR